MNKPFFSIIIASYNRASFIGKAIESVINQSFENWELIIVDDGSKDETKQVVTPFLQDKRIKYIYQKNQERSVARNNGIAQSKGQYICFLDSDDYYLPHHLETFHSYLKKNDSNDKEILTVSRSYETDGKQEVVWFKDDKFRTKNEELLHRAILDSPPIQCICINRNFFKKVRFENDWLPYAECNQFSFDLLLADYHFKIIPVHSVVMVNHDTNSTVYDYPFIKKKYKFVESYARKIKELKHPSVIQTRLNALLGMADTTQSRKEAANLLVKASLTSPAIIFGRYFWGIIRNKILKV